jgi:probable rRNA maturation factor
MNTVDFQIISQMQKIPSESQFKTWVDAVLSDESEGSEVVIRVIDEDEMITFNEQYRNKQGATNILSFPFEVPEGIDSILLGDLLLCAPVIEQEALQQNKMINHHWAHMIVHGILHLLGYDHIDSVGAEEMEAKEIEILKTITIKNPYLEQV